MNAFLKNFIDSRKRKKLQAAIKEYEHKQTQYLRMPTEQLPLLPEAELFDALYFRTQMEVDHYDSIVAGMKSLNNAKRIFFVTSYYEAEVNNGGLCQFFVNSSQAVAADVSTCLSEIGAWEHKQHYDSFIRDNSIDVTNLSSFGIDDVSQFEEQAKRYPFDEFDRKFYKMKPVFQYLMEYVKAHIFEF